MRLYANEACYNPELTETVKHKKKENDKEKGYVMLLDFKNKLTL